MQYFIKLYFLDQFEHNFINQFYSQFYLNKQLDLVSEYSQILELDLT